MTKKRLITPAPRWREDRASVTRVCVQCVLVCPSAARAAAAAIAAALQRCRQGGVVGVRPAPRKVQALAHSFLRRSRRHRKPMAAPGPSRDLGAAKAAAKAGDISASRAAHMVEIESIQLGGGGEKKVAKEEHKKGGERMKTCLFGGLDGIITTFAVVAGAGGGGLSVSVVLIMGFSSLVADALSMGVGDALSSKAEGEVAERERAREKWEFENFPEGEIKEMVEIYEGRGVSRPDAELIMNTLAKYPECFVDVMCRDELGMEPPEPSEKYDYLVSGAYCFVSFLVCGSVPLLGYVCVMPVTNDANILFTISCCLTALMLFILGALKSRFTAYSWWRSGLEVLVVGGSCAACAYLIGWLVERAMASSGLAHLGSGESGHVGIANSTGVSS